MLNTPVLFIIFNRPETTELVFAAIREAKPRQLFVAADGPRPGKEGEEERCMRAREIATRVDWDCELHTLFRDENIGCGRGPAEAITWFFEQVEQGIILEDDCLPDQSFFPFCEELLNKYNKNENIAIISGTKSCPDYPIASSYTFTKYAGIWGWASWKRAWKNFAFIPAEWQSPEVQEQVLSSLVTENERTSFKSHLDGLFAGRTDYWDYQWWFSRIKTSAAGIVPSKNLIQNIGFGNDATHTFDSNAAEAKRKAEPISFPLIHPPFIIRNEGYEMNVLGINCSQQPNETLLNRIKHKIKRYVSK